MQSRPYLDTSSGGGRAPTSSGLPMVVQTPERILVADVEVAFPGASKEPTILPPPPWGEG